MRVLRVVPCSERFWLVPKAYLDACLPAEQLLTQAKSPHTTSSNLLGHVVPTTPQRRPSCLVQKDPAEKSRPPQGGGEDETPQSGRGLHKRPEQQGK